MNQGTYYWRPPSECVFDADGLRFITIEGTLDTYQYDIIGAAVSETSSPTILMINSPGGGALGVFAVADLVAKAATTRPIVAIVNEVCASSAYLIASAANKILATSSSCVFGSIGIIATHEDYSSALEQAGIKTTVFSTGSLKRPGHLALSEDEKAERQGLVDDLFEQFLARLKANRGLDPQTMRNLNGAVYTTSRAIELGLIDGIIEEDLVVDFSFNRLRMGLGLGSAGTEVQPVETRLAEVSAKVEALGSLGAKVDKIAAALELLSSRLPSPTAPTVIGSAPATTDGAQAQSSEPSSMGSTEATAPAPALGADRPITHTDLEAFKAQLFAGMKNLASQGLTRPLAVDSATPSDVHAVTKEQFCSRVTGQRMSWEGFCQLRKHHPEDAKSYWEGVQ